MSNVCRFCSTLVLIVMFSVSGKCLTDQMQEVRESEEKLPVIINRGYKIVDENNIQALLEDEDRKFSSIEKSNLSAAKEMITRNSKQNKRLVPVEEKADIDYGKISKLVSSIRNELCSVNQGGSYEVWLQVEGGASGIFVSASAQTGIKAIINCSTEHK